MEFFIDKLENLDVTDREISDLLSEVYVQGGYTAPELARIIFAPDNVKNRGIMFLCMAKDTGELSGMVIVVPGSSEASVRAGANECEIHLLGVSPEVSWSWPGSKTGLRCP